MTDKNNNVAVEMKTMFDFADEIKTDEEGAVLNLNDKRGNPIHQADGKPVWIKLAGTNSRRWREAADIVGNRRLKRAGSKTGVAAKSMEEHREDQAYMYAAVTLDWSGILVEGEEWPCTPERVRDFYLRFPFVYNQVEEFVSDQANF